MILFSFLEKFTDNRCQFFSWTKTVVVDLGRALHMSEISACIHSFTKADALIKRQ